MNNRDDIRDDEIRIIGKPDDSGRTVRPVRRKWYLILGVILTAVLLTVLSVVRHTSRQDDVGKSGQEPGAESVSYTEHLRDTINDIPLNIYIPRNARPELVLGYLDFADPSLIFASRAADIRADNGEIVGTFVLKGKTVTSGGSKRGFCAIIDGMITLGEAENSPMFEDAVKNGGDFFRQYALVDNGMMAGQFPKGKSLRKALCERNGEIFIVMSSAPESFHDFAQALVDLNVTNAIYLVGSSAFSCYRDSYGSLNIITGDYPASKARAGKSDSYIVWKKCPTNV